MVDSYQDAYLAHQKRKKAALIQIIKERHSDRIFADTPVDSVTVMSLLSMTDSCPSSCDRHGVRCFIEDERDRKALLGGLLVGGTGWIHRAPTVLMLWADPLAYKAGGEGHFMPYLDAGIIAYQLQLLATASGLKSCFINPNVRDFNQSHFQNIFSPYENGVFCGALAIGHRVE